MVRCLREHAEAGANGDVMPGQSSKIGFRMTKTNQMEGSFPRAVARLPPSVDREKNPARKSENDQKEPRNDRED